MNILQIHVPVFNEEKNLPALFEALMAQSYKEVEYVFHDNASTDNSLNLIKSFSSKAPNIKIRAYPRNTGPLDQGFRIYYMARNSKYVGMRSANDLMEANYFERVIDLLETDSSIGLAYSHGKSISLADGSISQSESTKIETRGKNVLESAVEVMSKYTQSFSLWGIFRSDIFSMMQPYRYCHGGDHILICEAALYGKIAATDEVLDTRYEAPTQAGYGGILKNAQNQMEEHLRGVSPESFFYGMKHLQPFSDMIFGHIEMFSMSKVGELEKYQLCELAISVLGHRFAALIQYENKVYLDYLERSLAAIEDKRVTLTQGVYNFWASKAQKELQKILLLKGAEKEVVAEYRLRLDRLTSSS